MKTFTGSCHCGAVRFEVDTDLTWASECSCSICTKKGIPHHRVPPERFRLLAGQDALTLYRFGTGTAKHWFCKHCGIHPFTNPRAAPEKITVNIRCLDDCDAEKAAIEVRTFDGRNWEEAMRTFTFCWLRASGPPCRRRPMRPRGVAGIQPLRGVSPTLIAAGLRTDLEKFGQMR